MLTATCHCGSVRVEIPRRPRSLTQCNCSICRRYGTLWAYYRRRASAVVAPRGGLVAFTVRPRGRRFVRCATCGCVTSWEMKRGPEAWVGLNARLFDHAAIADVPVSVL